MLFCTAKKLFTQVYSLCIATRTNVNYLLPQL